MRIDDTPLSIPAQNPQLSTFKFGDQQIRVIDNTIFASKSKFET